MSTRPPSSVALALTAEAAAEVKPDDGRDNYMDAGVAIDSTVHRLDRLDALDLNINYFVGVLSALVSDEVWDQALRTCRDHWQGRRL